MKVLVVLLACLTLIGCGFASISETRPAGSQVSGFGAPFLSDPSIGKFRMVGTTRGTSTLELASFNSKSDVSGQDLLNALMLLNSLRGGAVIVPTTQP